MASFTTVFHDIQDVALYSERIEYEYPERGGSSEVIAQIQRMELLGKGDAQGQLASERGGERFSKRGAVLRVDVPLGRSHFWEDEAGGRVSFERGEPAENYGIMGAGFVDLARTAQWQEGALLLVKTRGGGEVDLRGATVTEERIDLDLEYQPLSPISFEIRLRRA